MSGAIGPALLLALYAWGVRRARRWPLRRTAAAVVGCVAAAAALAGPMATESARSLPGHMLQHLLIGVASPLALAASAPLRLAFASLPGPRRRALARVLHRPLPRALAHPAPATGLAVATVLAIHLTGAFDAAESSPVLHGLEHAALFWTGLLAWMAVLGVDPLPRAPSGVGALAWITAPMVAMTAIGAALAGEDAPRYSHYPSVAAQHDAGLVMWRGGAAILVPAAIAVAMWALERDERRQRRRDALADARWAGKPAHMADLPAHEAGAGR
jgi:cytochrome c oxidase assembly factor CtaG